MPSFRHRKSDAATDRSSTSDGTALRPRHRYAAPSGKRTLGLVATAAIYAIALLSFLVTFRRTAPVHPASTPTVLTLLPMSSPHEEPHDAKPPSVPVEKKPDPKPKTNPVVRPTERSAVTNAPTFGLMPTPPTSAPESAPPVAETAVTRTASPRAAPPVPPTSPNPSDTWEGKVLAALQRHRRYPQSARFRREQGVPYIRFVIDRDGKVLSSQLDRSSGFADLDREAVSLPKRAQPLPRPPADKVGATLELFAPVEFFIR